MKHTTHPEIVKRLNQAQGQLALILAMFADGRPSADLARQLHALESVIHLAKRTLVQDHMEHCVVDGVDQRGMKPDHALRNSRRSPNTFRPRRRLNRSVVPSRSSTEEASNERGA